MYKVPNALKYICLFLGVFILGVSYISKDILFDVIVFSITSIIVMRLLIRKDPLSSLFDIAPPVIGLLYIPVLFTFQTHIRKLGPEWIVFLYATVWMSDSTAYYLGKGIGKRKLYPEVSPNKTVAGAVGSVIGGLIGAVIIKTTILPMLSALYMVLIGIMIGFVTIIGDLVESMFKRDAGVKDSGIIIPGHGGILDKIDGMLFAGPVLYWMLMGLKIIK